MQQRNARWPIGLLLSACLLYGGTPMANGRTYTVEVPDFGAQPPEGISSAVDKVSASYRDVTAHIIGQLRDGGLSGERKVYAIYLLGELRAVAATSVLIEHLDLKADKVDPKAAIGRWGPYPAQEALVKIGTPAVNMVLDKLSTERNELRRQLMCAVISDAIGKRAGEAMVRFRHDEEQDASRRTHLEQALRLLQGP